MEKFPPNESIRKAAKILKIKPESLTKQLSNGKAPGHKDKNGYWVMTDQDIEKYKKVRKKIRKPPKNRMTTAQVALCLGVKIYQVIELIQDGSLRATKVANRWWITNESYFKALNARIDSYELTPLIICREKLKILNRHGVCPAVSTEIIKIFGEYSGLLMHIHKDNRKWPVENVLDISKHDFQQGEMIDLEIEGADAYLFMDEICKASVKLFGLTR